MIIEIASIVATALLFWFFGWCAGIGDSDSPFRPIPSPVSYNSEVLHLDFRCKNLEQENQQLRHTLFEEERKSEFYRDRSREPFMSVYEKSNWLNKDVASTKKKAEEKIKELQKIIGKL